MFLIFSKWFSVYQVSNTVVELTLRSNISFFNAVFFMHNVMFIARGSQPGDWGHPKGSQDKGL